MFLPLKLFVIELKRQGCYKEFLQYKKYVHKFDNCSERIAFLEKCRGSDLIPRFLLFRVPTNGCFDNDSVHNFQPRHRPYIHVEHLAFLPEEKLPNKLLPTVIVHSRLERCNRSRTIKSTYQKKILSLSERQQKPLFQVENTVIVHDVQCNIPNYVYQTLSLGPGHPVISKFDSTM